MRSLPNIENSGTIGGTGGKGSQKAKPKEPGCQIRQRCTHNRETSNLIVALSGSLGNVSVAFHLNKKAYMKKQATNLMDYSFLHSFEKYLGIIVSLDLALLTCAEKYVLT